MILIVGVFGLGVLRGSGLARRGWRALPKSDAVGDACTSAEVQTIELGLVNDMPDRMLRLSRWQQRCQRCFEDIPLGSEIKHFAEGWCHSWCDRRHVGRTVFLPGQQLE